MVVTDNTPVHASASQIVSDATVLNKLAFANGQTISSIWSASDTQSGANVTLKNLSYDGSIPAGGTVSGIGFNGTWNNVTNAVPASFAVNGTICN